MLRRATQAVTGSWYRGRVNECLVCPLRDRCLPPSGTVRTIELSAGYPALLRARRRRARWGAAEHALYARHRWRAEGVHGEAKVCHGLRRAARRRLWNVQIQAYLTATVQNLKRLAAFCRALPIPVPYDASAARWGQLTVGPALPVTALRASWRDAA